MNTAKAITIIPAIERHFVTKTTGTTALKRVAAYARVSTSNEEQLSSYEAQVEHYTQHIKANPTWTFLEIYTDEGISATSTKKRDGFNRMITDALNGKIDLILTKSVSRFARNTVDTLTTVRQLKQKGVEVYFEKENIYTMDSKGELLITIMSSLAQEESRSISENVTWGKRKCFADGKVNLPYGQFLGYEKGEDELPKIVEKEAIIVRMIYKLYLEGKTSPGIAKILTTKGIPTPAGKKIWHQSTVISILKNEKYKGDAILQKSFTVDFLTKKMKINEGEVPQYHVENSHPAIVSPEVFDLVQEEIKKRKAAKGYKTCGSCFSGKIVCGECGSYYGSKVWHSTSKHKRTIWQCNNKFKNDQKCRTPHLYEDKVKAAFVATINRLISNKEEIIENFEAVRHDISKTTALEVKFVKTKKEVAEIAGLIQACVNENAYTKLDQEEYKKRYETLISRYETVKARYDEIIDNMHKAKVHQDKIEAFLNELRKQNGLIDEFDENLWNTLLDNVTINVDDIIFTFKNGMEISINQTRIE